MNRPAPPIDEDDLHALVDGQLAPERRAAVEHALARDPALAAKAADWRRQREALRHLHDGLLDEPVPPPLRRAIEGAGAAQPPANGWLRLGGIAAGVLVAFAAGWLGSAQWSAHTAARPATIATRAPALREFVHAAAVAHTVYAPERRHPVEVAAAEQQHLVQWLSKRLDRPLKIPDLTPMGYALVGGRLLPGDSGARAQFMFEDPAGERVTLYVGALDGPATAPAPHGETAFRFATEGSVPSFYWVDQGFGYAIAGKLPREDLLKLATLAYRNLY